jgi:hydrogenase maturation protease
VEVVDGGASGLDLLPYMEKRDKVLVIDAVNFGREPGFIGMVENDDIPAFLQSKVSLHHLGLADVLSAAKLMDASPRELCLIGVQPYTVDLGLDMSREMWDKVEILLDRVVKRLQEWGVPCALPSPQRS